MGEVIYFRIRKIIELIMKNQFCQQNKVFTNTENVRKPVYKGCSTKHDSSNVLMHLFAFLEVKF